MTSITINSEICDEVETLLMALLNQLKTARTAAAIAYEYIDLDNSQAAIGTLTGVADEIKEVACLHSAILNLLRNRDPAPCGIIL